jgi:hypothetical protein
MSKYMEKAAACTWKRALTRISPCWHPELGLPVPEFEEINFFYL